MEPHPPWDALECKARELAGREDVLQAPALGVQRDSWLRACETGANDILPPLVISVLERQTREGRKGLQRTKNMRLNTMGKWPMRNV